MTVPKRGCLALCSVGGPWQGESMQIGRGRWVGSVFKWADRVIRSVSVVVGAFAKATPEKFPEVIAGYVRALQQGWIVPFLLIVGPAIIWTRHKTDRSKLVAVHALLDQMCDNTFRNEKFELDQHRRVTLFRHAWFCWRRYPFFGGWLIPIERSGIQTRKTDAIFRAPDDGEKCEGVAGRAWGRKHKVFVPGLPSLRANEVTDLDFQEYAEKSFCSEKRLRKKPPQARCLLGIPIDAGNQKWGVIVIDSVNPNFSQKSAQEVFNKLAPTMSSYLKGV